MDEQQGFETPTEPQFGSKSVELLNQFEWLYEDLQYEQKQRREDFTAVVDMIVAVESVERRTFVLSVIGIVMGGVGTCLAILNMIL